MTIRVGERFKPDPALKRLYYVYLLLSVLILLVPIVFIIIMVPYWEAKLILSWLLMVVCLLIVLPSAVWIHMYYYSVFYTFTDNEIVVEKGIWWKHRSIVPYNRITNIDIRQGPLSRSLGLWELRVQTAGYHVSSGGYGVAEAVLQGIKNVEEIRGFVLNMVMRLKPVAVEAGVETAPSKELDQEILAELKKIREILEDKSA
ncbi:MAG: PH domain-containing protein [Thermoproteota archaeon]